MERVTVKKGSLRQYFFLTAIIVLTSFEYFFRESNLVLLVYCLAILCFLAFDLKRTNIKSLNTSLMYLACITVIVIMQIFSGVDRVNYLVGMIITGLGSISIARILRGKFVSIFTNIIFFISLYSLVIYLLCFIPGIESYLYSLGQKFPSLNYESAVFNGGGTNIIIYNFQSAFISEIIGFRRNCGPFWEPGMFAFFINIALFFEIFFYRHRGHLFRIIIYITALVSSFSTGGYVAGLFLMVLYAMRHRSSVLTWVIFIPIMVVAIFQIFNLEYVGDKIDNQYNTAQYGSDDSRFGAFITQVKMIENSPIIGGEEISNYAQTRTLASGTLLPLVEYGIPIGILYFIILLTACKRIALQCCHKKAQGLSLFIFILVLSFSQTILLSSIIYLLFYYGLQLPQTFATSKQVKIPTTINKPISV